MSESSSEYSQESVSPRASISSRSSKSDQTASLAHTEEQMRHQRRLQIRGIVFLGMAFIVLALFTGPTSSWAQNFQHGSITTFDEHESFLIKTICPQRPEFSNLYVYYLKVTSNVGNAMLHRDDSVALNATLETGGDIPYQGRYGLYNVLFKGPYSTTELVPYKNVKDLYGGLQPVGISVGQNHPATYNAFYFSGRELRWTDEVDALKPGIFDSWIACKTDHPDPYDQYNRSAKAIQLLYRPFTYSAQLPQECDTVKLIRSKD